MLGSLKKRQLKIAAMAVDLHLNKILDLRQARASNILMELHAMVLADNFELVSHASRGLVQLRIAQEISGVTSEVTELFRNIFMSLLELPAIPHRAVKDTTAEEIERLYAEWDGRPRTDEIIAFENLENWHIKNHGLPESWYG